MNRCQPVAALLILALAAACGAPAASPSPGVSGTLTASVPTASPSRSPTLAPTPSPTPSPTLTPATPSPTVAPPTPSPTPTTMVVRAYFLLRDGSGGEVVNEPTLVPVLRTVPKSPATATAAMKALLAGPSAKERSAGLPIKTLLPAGTKLLGIEISGGLATVDLSAEFASLSPDDASDLGSYSLHGRLAQVVYTLTQFTTVDRVNFKLDGKRVKVMFGMADPDGSSEAIVLDKPVTRATYRDHYLPVVFVDRPAWGAALLKSRSGHGFRQCLRGAVPDHRARSQRQGAGRCSGGGELRNGLLGPLRRDAVVPRVARPVGNAAGLGHLGVQRPAGCGPRVSGLPPPGTVRRIRLRSVRGTSVRLGCHQGPRRTGSCARRSAVIRGVEGDRGRRGVPPQPRSGGRRLSGGLGQHAPERLVVQARPSVRYVADVLQNLEVLAELGQARDPRLSNAIEWLLVKQDARGRWTTSTRTTARSGSTSIDIAGPANG